MAEVLDLNRDYKLVLERNFLGKHYKFLFVSIPEIGLVGLLALRHLVKDLKLEQVGFIFSDATSLMLRYENGEPLQNIRVYGNDDILVLMLEIPVTPANTLSVGRLILDFYNKVNADFLVMFGSAPSITRERKNIEELLLLGVPVGENAKKLLNGVGVESLKNGTLTGPYAYVLNNMLKDSRDSLILLAETYPAPITADPESAGKVLLTVSKMINKTIDITELKERAEEIKLEMRKLHQLATTPRQREIGDLYT